MGVFEKGNFVRIPEKPELKTYFHEGNYNWYEGTFEWEESEVGSD